MIRVKLWIGLILVFILGAFAGSVGTGLYYKNRTERLTRYGHAARSHLLLKRLSRELSLTEAQKKEIGIIVDQFQTKLSQIKRSVRPDIRKLRDESFSAIRESLTDDQKNKFDDLRKRLERWTPRQRLQASLKHRTPEQIISQMKTRLKLTDEQEAKIRPIIIESFKEQEEILDKPRNQNRSGIRALRSELRQHQISVEEKLSKTLTAEQLVEYRKLPEEQRRRIP
jgi:Spy/CpxP family protein refolding chaperone